jgi:probable F420-dependent oxidoreductase
MRFGMLVNTQAPPDGSRIPELYREILDEAVLAEEVGFESVLVPEHHLMPDGYLPQPLIMLAAIATRTNRIRLGTGIMHLPERDPIHVAEEIAVLDNLSNGRVSLGVGLNLVAADFRLFGVPMKGAARRFEEQLQILQDVWTQTAYSHSGEFYQYEDITVTPRVLQKPHPPLWIGAMAEPSLKRAGRMGLGWVTDPLHNMDVMTAWGEIFRGAAEEAGKTPGPIVLKRDAWVSRDQRQLADVWWPTLRAHHLFYKNLGFFSSGRFNTDWEPWIADISDDDWTYDRIVPNRNVAGSPQQVVEQIHEFTERMGCDELVFSIRHAMGPDHKATMECIETFGSDVFPHFQ